MKAIIVKVGEKKKSMHGGIYQRCVFKDLNDGKQYIFDCYHNHEKSARFIPYLKEQNILDNLTVIDGKYINGYSNFTFLKNRHERTDQQIIS